MWFGRRGFLPRRTILILFFPPLSSSSCSIHQCWLHCLDHLERVLMYYLRKRLGKLSLLIVGITLSTTTHLFHRSPPLPSVPCYTMLFLLACIMLLCCFMMFSYICVYRLSLTFSLSLCLSFIHIIYSLQTPCSHLSLPSSYWQNLPIVLSLRCIPHTITPSQPRLTILFIFLFIVYFSFNSHTLCMIWYVWILYVKCYREKWPYFNWHWQTLVLSIKEKVQNILSLNVVKSPVA